MVYPRHPRLTLEQEIHLRRSKSFAEGRSSGADELDIWLNNPDEFTDSDTNSSPRTVSTMAGKKKGTVDLHDDDEFKCGVLCLYLPEFSGGGKAKPVRERKAMVESGVTMRESIILTVSLEKFECGSWASSAVINENERGDSTRFYYDLPMELIKTGGNETNSPVAAVVLFDKDQRAFPVVAVTTPATSAVGKEGFVFLLFRL